MNIKTWRFWPSIGIENALCDIAEKYAGQSDEKIAVEASAFFQKLHDLSPELAWPEYADEYEAALDKQQKQPQPKLVWASGRRR